MTVDAVGIYDANFKQLLTSAQAMRADIVRGAKLFTHPLENGATVSDHKIINAVRIELIIFLRPADYKSVYQTIKQLFTANGLLVVHTRADTFPGMTIEKMPHEETVDMVDTVVVNLTLVEAQLTAAQYGTLTPSKVADPAQSSTRDRGEQLPGAPKDQQGSFLYRQFLQ